MAQTLGESSLSLLTRLAQKPGVRSTLVLSRSNGAIVQTSGLSTTSTSSSTSTANSTASPLSSNGMGNAPRGRGARREDDEDGTGEQSAEETARFVWDFVQASEVLARGMAGRREGESEGEGKQEDEVRLLRVRTRRGEVVIVPDAKFLLVVIHDTPPA
ncbi:hypothetical protein B0A49_00960 [Cryomyces minteri]|uniref:Roadblock/LAMTOR2 domain-containing protein n=1 Tax=Cryomyces minteri TaxID=331657 RepID=A0A4U0XVQ6_9PEZI|nr:hypothetical protein B0A49_00960 [Cryomyces minteri]